MYAHVSLPNPRRRRSLTFSLRTLVVVTAIAALGITWVRSTVRQHALSVRYFSRFNHDSIHLSQSSHTPFAYRWLQIYEPNFVHADGAAITKPDVTTKDLEQLRALSSLKSVSVTFSADDAEMAYLERALPHVNVQRSFSVGISFRREGDHSESVHYTTGDSSALPRSR